MPEELTPEELDDIDPDEHSNPNVVRTLRNQAKTASQTAAEARREAEALKRENSLLKAGIDTGTRLGKLFADSHEGSLDDPAKVATAYLEFQKELGISPAPEEHETAGEEQGNQQSQQQQAEPPEPNGTRERQELSNGAQPPGGQNPNRRAEILREQREAMNRGATFEEAAGELVNKTVNAWRNGDITALVGDGVPAS